MNQSELWSSIRYDLMCACQALPNDAGIHEAIGQCREYLEHNELELACDALERYGNENPVPSDFFGLLFAMLPSKWGFKATRLDLPPESRSEPSARPAAN